MIFNICHEELFLVNQHKSMNESSASLVGIFYNPHLRVKHSLLTSLSATGNRSNISQVLATSKERIYEDMNGC